MMTNSGDGFTDADLELILQECAAAAQPPLSVRRADNGSLELCGAQGSLVTLCPAGQEPFDYLLVDFIQRQGWDEAPQVRVLAEVAEKLDLNVLELESRLEYNARQWAVVRGRYHSPDPTRREEARGLELDREIQFFERRGLPYSPEDTAILRAAVQNVDDEAVQRSAQEIRDRKKKEDRPAVPIKGHRYTDRSEGSGWWPFRRKRIG
ncbi:MAG: hypothetical protein M3Y56_07350 [Armatimonadota bacterium]|nr:hypothetical protein [Armatimonadota bacterium]